MDIIYKMVNVCTTDINLVKLSSVDTFMFVSDNIQYFVTFKYIGCWNV